jgi:hypothetical protein
MTAVVILNYFTVEHNSGANTAAILINSTNFIKQESSGETDNH